MDDLLCGYILVLSGHLHLQYDEVALEEYDNMEEGDMEV